MSSTTIGELKCIFDQYPDDTEVIMNIRHKYDIPKEEGEKGWIAYIAAVKYDEDYRELRLMNA